MTGQSNNLWAIRDRFDLHYTDKGVAGSSTDPAFSMDGHSLSSVSDSPAGSNDEAPRVKFLCSFSGSIIPRPLDGRLRYVGGETRIVSVSRDIGFEELMSKMRELFEGVAVLKYQQPDEDLDALVSVVNDEDVVNMMEEYDKLGSGDGFTRLRIFLFSQPEHDLSTHYDGDERESERRYVDALNNFNDGLDFRKPSQPESPVDDFNSLNLNYEFPMPQYNLHHLSIPVQHHQMMNPRYTEVEAPWSPAYYSPRNPMTEFPSSPSSARFHVPFGELPDEYLRQQANQPFEHQPQVPDSVSWLPGGTGEKSAFPGNNLIHGPSGIEGNSICENCRMAFQRNFENPSMNNGFHQAVNPCTNCPTNREALMHHHGMYHDEQSNDNRSLYNGSVRANDYYANNNMVDSRVVPSNYLPDQPVVGLSHIHVPPPEESGVRYGNVPIPFVGENHYSAQGHFPNHSLRRNIPSQTHVAPSYEASQFNNGKVNPGLPRSQWIENQNQWNESSKMSAFEGKPVAEYAHANTSRLNSTTPVHENQQLVSPDLMLDRTKEAVRLEGSNVQAASSLEGKDVNNKDEEISSLESITSRCSKAAGENADAAITQGQKDNSAIEDLNSVAKLHVLHELIASAKKTALDVASAMKAQAEENMDCEKIGSTESPNADSDSDGDNTKRSGVETTKAEAEAIGMGLQVIKSEDIEEIRELGSGTYGSVYHGKWRGSDVAIKRIKSSCFHGRPHERKRLIADFWKEALILGSLHHPNVVSFYGIVHGADGSLATVTEFMINGSLKQFLQKKDRTIDRRKRLIIAMDAAFGMEYLHEKNIVHFDLKCENLLVNMRDPQRPICKIGDLGLSKVKQHTLVSGGVRGTLPWMAPELLTGKTEMVTEKIDVYSFGIVMWELLTGEEPYADLHCSSVIGGIVNNTLRPQVPTWCDPEWKALMESSWASDPAHRPSFSEISQKLRSMAAAMNVK